VNYKAALKYLY